MLVLQESDLSIENISVFFYAFKLVTTNKIYVRNETNRWFLSVVVGVHSVLSTQLQNTQCQDPMISIL